MEKDLIKEEKIIIHRPMQNEIDRAKKHYKDFSSYVESISICTNYDSFFAKSYVFTLAENPTKDILIKPLQDLSNNIKAIKLVPIDKFLISIQELIDKDECQIDEFLRYFDSYYAFFWYWWNQLKLLSIPNDKNGFLNRKKLQDYYLIIDKATKLYEKSNKRIAFSTNQMIIHITGAVNQLIGSLNAILGNTSFSPSKDVSKILSDLKENLQVFVGTLINGDSQTSINLSGYDISNLYKIRQELIRISFSSYQIDRVWCDSPISSKISIVLYFLDQIVKSKSLLVIPKTTPSDVYTSCILLEKSLRELHLVPSPYIERNSDFIGCFIDVLQAAGHVFDSPVVSHENSSCLSYFVDELKPKMGRFLEHLMNEGIGEYCIKTYHMWNRFESSLLLLEFNKKGQLLLNQSSIVTQTFKYDTMITDALNLCHNYSLNSMSYSDVCVLYINPFRDSRSIKNESKLEIYQKYNNDMKTDLINDSLEKIVQIEQLLDQINDIDVSSFNRIVDSGKLLNDQAIIFDLIRSSPEFSKKHQSNVEKYVNCIRKFNNCLSRCFEFFIPPLSEFSLFGLSQALLSLMSYLINNFESSQSLKIVFHSEFKSILAQLKYQHSQLVAVIVKSDLIQLLEHWTNENGKIMTLLRMIRDICEECDKVYQDALLLSVFEHFSSIVKCIDIKMGSYHSRSFSISLVLPEMRMIEAEISKQLFNSCFGSGNHYNRVFIYILSNILHRVSLFITSLGLDNPKRILTPVCMLFSQITSIWEIYHYVVPDTISEKIRNRFESIIWMLYHLDSDYLLDDQLNTILSQVKVVIEAASDKSKGSKFEGFFYVQLTRIQTILKRLNIYNPRSGEEPKAHTAIFEQIIKDLIDEWKPPGTNDFAEYYNQICSFMNNAIQLYGGNKIKIPVFEDPSVSFKSSPYLEYIKLSSYEYGDNKFWKTAKNSIIVQLPQDIFRIKDSIFLLLAYIDTDSVNIESGGSKREFALSLLYSLSIAKLIGYNFFDKLLNLSIKFLQEIEIQNLTDLTFNMMYHLRKILEIADTCEVLDKVSLEKQLLQNFLDHNPVNLGLLAYLSDEYSRNSGEHSLFAKLSNQLKNYFFRAANYSSLDFSDAISFLRKELPPELQQRQLTLEEEKEFIYKSIPIKINQYMVNEFYSPSNNPQLNLFNNWAMDSISLSGFRYSINLPNPISYPKSKDEYTNEFNLSEADTGRSQNYIHVPYISQVLRYIADTDRAPALKYSLIGSLYPSKYSPSFSYQIRPPNHEFSSHFLQIVFKSISVEGNPIDDLVAMIYLLDSRNNSLYSQPVYLRVIKGRPVFVYQSVQSVIFDIPSPNSSLYLVCRLLHNQAAMTSEFLSYLSTKNKPPMPVQSPFQFAVSAIRLFDDSGHFLENQVFPSTFHVIQGSTVLESDLGLLSALEKPPIQRINANVEFRGHFIESIGSNFMYNWAPNNTNNLIITPIKSTLSSIPPPIITISNIRFSFKNPPKGRFVYFYAFLADDDSNIMKPYGRDCIVSYESHILMGKYVSTMVPSTNNTVFPDMIQLVMNKPLTEKSHLIIHLFVTSPQKAATLYKVSVFTFIEGKNWINSDLYEIPLFEAKAVNNKGYLPLKKLTPQSKTHFSIDFPALYFPHRCFYKLFCSTNEKEIGEIETKDVPRQSLYDSFVPVVARFLKHINRFTIGHLISFLSAFEVDEISPMLRSWLFNNFSLENVNSGFFDAFFVNYCSNIQFTASGPNNAQKVLQMINILKTAPHFLDIALLVILIAHSQFVTKNVFPKDFAPTLTMFCATISYLITQFVNLEMSNTLNKSFSTFMYLIGPIVPQNVFLHSISHYINQLQPSNWNLIDLKILFPENIDPKSKNQPPPPPIPHPAMINTPNDIRSIELQLDFLTTFVDSNTLIANASVIKDESDQIFPFYINTIAQTFEIGNLSLINRALTLFSTFVRTIENFPLISAQCGDLLIPYLTFAVKYHQRNELVGDYNLLQHFVIPVLFVLHSARRNTITKYYSSLNLVAQNEFIQFLCNLVVSILTPVKGESTLGTLRPMKNMNEELRSLRNLKSQASSINYNIFNELTMRILEFIDTILKAKIDLQGTMKPLIMLLTELLNRHQSPSSIRDVILLTAHFVDRHTKLFFYSHSEYYDILVKNCLRLIYRHMRIARAAGTALLIHFFFIDYMTTGNILITAHHMFDHYINTVMEVSEFKVGLFSALLDRLQLFLSNIRIPEFVSLCKERINAGKKMYSALTSILSQNKSPEHQTEQMYQLSDQFFTYPMIRLKWLKKIVTFNTDHRQWSSVFITQMHIAALSCNVIHLYGKERLSKLDFGFIESTSLESNVSIDHAEEKIRHLLVEDELFTVSGLVRVLTESITNALNGNMFWLVRWPHFHLITLYEAQRNFAVLSTIANGIHTNYTSINDNTSPALYFYLIERKQNGITIDDYVYSSHLSTLDLFVQYLNNIEHHRYDVHEVATAFKSIDDSTQVLSNICVFSIESLKPISLNSQLNEFYHEVKVNSKGWDSVAHKRYQIITKDNLPSLSNRSPVVSITCKEYTKLENTQKQVNERIDSLKEQRDTLYGFFPPEHLKEDWCKNRPFLTVKPIVACINRALEQSFTNELIEASKVFENVKTLSRSLIDMISSSLQVYIRAVNEIKEASQNAIVDFAMFTQKTTELARNLSSPKPVFPPADFMKDPLDYKKDYEDY